HMSEQTHNASRYVTYSASRAGRCLEARIAGDVRLSDDDTDVLDLPDGSSLFVREQTPSGDRQAMFSGDRSREMLRQFSVDGTSRPFDADARDWVARVLPRVAR